MERLAAFSASIGAMPYACFSLEVSTQEFVFRRLFENKELFRQMTIYVAEPGSGKLRILAACFGLSEDLFDDFAFYVGEAELAAVVGVG
jgi:hypothetical protein